MKMAILQSLFCFLSIGLFADTPLCPDGKHWEPLPPDAWQIQGSDSRESANAIIQEYRVQINPHLRGKNYNYIESQRIRICNEAGKAAACFAPFSGRIKNLIGRTILPDGRIIPFDDIKDFVKKDMITSSYENTKHARIIPPGITDNCIVEIQWEEPFFTMDAYGTAHGDLTKFGKISNPYFIKNLIIDVCDPIVVSILPYNTVKSVYNLKSTAGHKIFTWCNIEGFEPEPFSIAATHPAPGIAFIDLPKILYSAAKKGPDSFWDACGVELFKSIWISHTIKAYNYAVFSKTMLKDLPNTPQALAIELARRVREYFVNLDNMTYQETKSRPKDEPWPDIFDFEQVISKKETTQTGMFLIFYNLMKELPVQKKLLVTCGRSSRLFKYSELNLNQFQNYYLGIDEPGKETLWITPSQKYCPPGLILATYQATPALEYDLQTWKAKLAHIPVQPMEFNQLQYNYNIDILNDEDHFVAKGNFIGLPAFYRRNEMGSLANDEQIRHTKDQLEANITGLACDKIQFFDLTDINKPLLYQVEGKIEREAGKRREVVPFPGMPFPFAIPASFPEKRISMIVLPYALMHSARSTFAIPEGYEVVQSESIEQSNTLGRITWKADTEQKTVNVTLRVELKTVVLSSAEDQQVQAFIGWLKDAFTRKIVLKRSSAVQ